MRAFDQAYAEWMAKQIKEEPNLRRKHQLQRGLTHGTITYLRTIWYPAFGNFDHLYAEYEVRDMRNGYRYLDLVYMPGGARGCIEIQDYRSHARDIDTGRFKDLCMKQALLALDDWLFMPIAYLSITEDAASCKQLTLSLVGKFVSMATPLELHWAEAETLRYARRVLRPIAPRELAEHLRLSGRHTREVLSNLVEKNLLTIVGGRQRYRTFRLAETSTAGNP